MMGFKAAGFVLGVMCVSLIEGSVVPVRPGVRFSALAQENLRYDVSVAGKLTEENIELNYEENYVRITTPALGRVKATTMIHDYTQTLTMFKQNGRCFMMNEYNDVPERMEDWYNLKMHTVDDVIQTVGEESYRYHNYKIVPFALDRTNLPAVMQSECEEIYLMVLEGTTEGAPVRQKVPAGQDCGFLGVVYLPSVEASGRSKRSASPGCGVCFFGGPSCTTSTGPLDLNPFDDIYDELFNGGRGGIQLGGGRIQVDGDDGSRIVIDGGRVAIEDGSDGSRLLVDNGKVGMGRNTDSDNDNGGGDDDDNDDNDEVSAKVEK